MVWWDFTIHLWIRRSLTQNKEFTHTLASETFNSIKKEAIVSENIFELMFFKLCVWT